MLKTGMIILLGISLNQGLNAEDYFSFYGGYQTSPHSNVSGTDEDGNNFDFTAGWEGKSFTPPTYYGFRDTKWIGNNTGVSLDFSHAKAYADSETLDKSEFETLEFTDGLNILTVNYLKRYPDDLKSYYLYWGVGAGITLPHVEVQTSPTSSKTYEYQFGGYALQVQLGAEKNLSETWGLFAEYKFNYTLNDVDLNGGGNLKTNIITNAINLGVNYKF